MTHCCCCNAENPFPDPTLTDGDDFLGEWICPRCEDSQYGDFIVESGLRAQCWNCGERCSNVHVPEDEDWLCRECREELVPSCPECGQTDCANLPFFEAA